VYTWRGNRFYKVRVSGPMDKNHIIHACRRKGMRPVCDHHAYRDSHCFDSRVNLHFSHPSHDRNGHLKFPVSKAKGIFWYTGRHGHGSLYNTGGSHRWRNGNDKNGLTMCTKKPSGGGRVYTWRGNRFYKVRVSGPMDKNHIIHACRRKGLRPVCDHHAYRDGHCFDSRVNLHFSHPHHNRHGNLRFPVSKAKGIFWYTGRHGHGSLYNTGSSHRWRNGNDRNGWTMCTNRNNGHLRRHVYTWRRRPFYKVRVRGPMDKNHIIRACAHHRLRPVCDHHAYRDGHCFDSRVNLHFSHPSHDRHGHLRFPVSKAKGIFWYTGRHGHGSLYNTGRTHRWRNGNDRNGWTMCTTR